jgi:hypothetical protein
VADIEAFHLARMGSVMGTNSVTSLLSAAMKSGDKSRLINKRANAPNSNRHRRNISRSRSRSRSPTRRTKVGPQGRSSRSSLLATAASASVSASASASVSASVSASASASVSASVSASASASTTASVGSAHGAGALKIIDLGDIRTIDDAKHLENTPVAMGLAWRPPSTSGMSARQ